MKSGLLLATIFLFITTLSPAQKSKNDQDGAGTPLAENPAALEAGQQRFRQLCSSCHGVGGQGGHGEGQGPNLINSWEVRRASDQRLFSFIRNGVPGSAMPPFSLPNQQIWELVAFVRSLNAPAISVPVTGDVKAGRAIFFGRGDCSACHMIQGQGGFLGPDLSNVGATHHLNQLRDAILKPSTSATEGFQPVLLKMPDGRSIEGVAKHYSNYSIQILDKHGRLHLLRGKEMRNVIFKKKSWMPDDYSHRLTPEEIEDLVAFLSRQSVRPVSKLRGESASTASPREPN